MLLRYKTRPEEPFNASRWNIHAMAEVLTGDDTVSIKDLDCFIERADIGWMDMSQALSQKLIISDNYQEYFREYKTPEESEKGYYD